MHLVWTYGAVDARQTEMTWDMCFELPEDQKHQEEQWCQSMLDHTESNQKRMKAYIERYVKEQS